MVSVRVSTTAEILKLFFRGEKQWRPKKIISRSKRGFCEIERGKISAKFGGCFNKTIIPLGLVGYGMIIANSALRASLAIYIYIYIYIYFFFYGNKISYCNLKKNYNYYYYHYHWLLLFLLLSSSSSSPSLFLLASRELHLWSQVWVKVMEIMLILRVPTTGPSCARRLLFTCIEWLPHLHQRSLKLLWIIIMFHMFNLSTTVFVCG